MTVRKLQQKRGWAWNIGVADHQAAAAGRPRSAPGSTARGCPPTGGCIVVFNHLSHVDPLTAAHLVYDHGRLPRYLAKSGLFKNRRSASSSPRPARSRSSGSAATAVGAYDAAVRAVRAGECVVVYPEGTLTRDPDLWPMTGKSGAARIALGDRRAR